MVPFVTAKFLSIIDSIFGKGWVRFWKDVAFILGEQKTKLFIIVVISLQVSCHGKIGLVLIDKTNVKIC